MKAITCPRYGPPEVLELADLPTPVPKGDQVLIKVHAASVNAGDWHLMRGDPWLMRLALGFRKPKYPALGSDVAGRVEAVGDQVGSLRPGDEVYGDLSESGFGAFAEFACAPESAFARKPERLSFEEAAAVPGSALAALQGLRNHGEIQAGQRVAINGASGGVGSFAVQLARSFGADVTAVCHPDKGDMVARLGADRIVDYTQEDFTQYASTYDLILDAAAFRSISDYRHALTPEGTYVLAGGSTVQFFQISLLGALYSIGGRSFKGYLTRPNREDLDTLRDLIEAGKVTPAIDRRFPLADVAGAIRHLESRKVRGKVVIVVADG